MFFNTKFNFKLKFIIILIFILSITIFPSCCAAQETPTVIFDETGPYGKYYTIYNLGPYGASSFANSLEKNGFIVSRLTDIPITNNNLQGDVLILMAPGRNYTADEIQAIKTFVNNGGGLFLVGDNWGVEDGNENYAYNQIAKSFGVNFAYNVDLVDNKNYILFPDYVEISNIQSDPITSNIDKFYNIKGTYIENPGSAIVLANSSSNSWADQLSITTEGFSISNQEKEANETSGTFPVLAALKYGNGRVVFMGAAGTFTNAYIYRSNGWKLGLNSVNWLADRPAPTTYQNAPVFSPTLADLEYNILGFLFYSLIVLGVLIFKIFRNKKIKKLKPVKTIKNWKYNGLMALNGIFIILGVILFLPINLFLFDLSNPDLYDPNLGYSLVVTGLLFLFFSSIILYNIYARLRILVNYNYFNIAILLIFSGLTLILGDIFAFPMMGIFTFAGLFLLIPSMVNLWINRKYGSDIIIEGKEFNRLEKLSFKALPYELHPLYKESAYIGEGGFGRVFKAKRQDDQNVAIKIPKSFDKQSEKIFITEVSNWENLNHPHIVKLYDFKILPIPYIEMEYCESSLSHSQKPVEEAVSIVYEVAQGLDYAHAKNIIHGDIKTSNIMICGGVYKISDWGLSKLTTDESVTLSGATPQYAAPEQISQKFGRADKRTDIYQLGVIFYEQLTGELPFKGEISQLYDSILNTKPLAPSNINPDASFVENIIMKCLSKNKDERYSSMEELIKDLEEYYKPSQPMDKTVLFKDEENENE
ncbi:MAG: DUF4350 domain-containing protein [Methanomicrobiales archaeon]